MLLEALLALATVLPRLEAGAEGVRRHPPLVLAVPGETVSVTSLPYFNATARAVSNWREEAASALQPRALALVARYAATEPGFVARCVKLNNYWCIKQARWSGELGGDAEGHTGFATAADGADAAALLLRRYYREFGRRSALAIVRRWAPAECGLTGRFQAPAATGTVAGRPAKARVSVATAPHGIGNTLRARFLARHARVRSAAPKAPAEAGLRVQPWSARARLAGHPRQGYLQGYQTAGGPRMPPVGSDALLTGRRTATAETGPLMPPTGRAALLPAFRAMTRDPSALPAPDRLVAESAALPSIAGSGLLDLTVPAPLCTNDETRIRNYAGRIAGSVGLGLDDDLGLFATDGTPDARLAKVMLAMSRVELGALHATPTLVAGAIERLSLRQSAGNAVATSVAVR